MVSRGVASTLNSEFCDTADALKRERGVTEERIAEVAQRVVEKYLEAQTRSDGPGPPSLRASIGAELGLPGLARPHTPRWCVLKMVYEIAADKIVVDGETFSSIAELLVKPGTLEIKGYKSSTEVCSGNITVDVPAGGTFHCKRTGK